MRWRRPARRPRHGGILGVALLILSLAHTPLPQPDFHNIRHHHGKGQVCAHHDHLLRWHPGATAADDVAVLHWHWFLPGTPGSDPSPVGPGLAVHAHAPAWQSPDWDGGPRVVASSAPVRTAARPAPCPSDHLPLAVPGPALLGFVAPSGTRPPLAFSATFAPGISLTSRFHRWTC